MNPIHNATNAASSAGSNAASGQGPLRLLLVTASTRQGRFGPTVATWFTRHADAQPEFEVHLADLADHDIPNRIGEPSTDVDRFAKRLEAADAVVIVTPEYNHSFPGTLKNAIDHVRDEWAAKPVGLVSYGGLSGGLRAVEHLRQVFAEFHAVALRDTVSVHWARQAFDAHGHPHDPESLDEAAARLLERLAWWGAALRNARTRNPFHP